MILKFIRSKNFAPKCEYIKVPDDAIIHRTRTHEDEQEDWVIVLDSKYYDDHYKDIYGKTTKDLHIQSVILDKYTFIFFYNIVPYNWYSISKRVFNDIFQPFFNSIYIYESIFMEKKAAEACKMIYNSHNDIDYNMLTQSIRDCSIVARAFKIKSCCDGGFDIIEISWTDNFGNDTGMHIGARRVMPCDLLNNYGYKSTISIEYDSYDFDMLMKDCYNELGFNEWLHGYENL